MKCLVFGASLALILPACGGGSSNSASGSSGGSGDSGSNESGSSSSGGGTDSGDASDVGDGGCSGYVTVSSPQTLFDTAVTSGPWTASVFDGAESIGSGNPASPGFSFTVQYSGIGCTWPVNAVVPFSDPCLTITGSLLEPPNSWSFSQGPLGSPSPGSLTLQRTGGAADGGGVLSFSFSGDAQLASLAAGYSEAVMASVSGCGSAALP